MAKHCMEDYDKTFIDRIEVGDVIVAGKNFGCGSSREHAPRSIKAAGISCVIAKGFSRIFYRNAINIGLPILVCQEAVEEASEGDIIQVDFEAGMIINEAVQIALFGKLRDDCFVESVATPGGCGALRHAVRNFLNDNEAAITTDYHWGPYQGICEEHNRKLATFAMFNENGKFNLVAFDQKITEIVRTQDQLLLILNTPANNPTGYSMTREEMEQTAAIIKKHAEDRSKKITVCMDVSYIDFDGGFEETRAVFEPFKDMPDNTMVTVIFSMSKSFTMCGLRCGALVCLGETKEAAQMFKQAMSFSSRSTWSNVVRPAQKVLTIPCKDPGRTAQKLQEYQVYIVPVAQGIRFSPCAVTKEKCLRAPGIIKEVLEGGD